MTSQCFVCSNILAPFINVGKFKVYKCLNCGLGVTEDLKAQHGDYHRDGTYIEEEGLFNNIFLKRVNIMMKFAKPKKILEIGCSTGLMLNLFANKDCEVVGIELSKKSAGVAKARGINVITGDFLKINLKQKFDLIIFNHTIEHINNPYIFLKKATSLLNKDGFLYIDLPNFDSLSAKLLKGNWPLLLPKEHLWHFTPLSLEILLCSLGFKIIFIERSSGIWDYNNPIAGVFNSLMGFKKRFFREVITALPTLVVSKLQMGSDLMVIAKKN